MTTIYSNPPKQSPDMPPGTPAPGEGSMVDAVLHEVVSRLDIFATEGEPATIDLASLPLSEGERQEIERRLGRGEVDARLLVAGESELWETSYSGVWWVRHRGVEGRVACEQIVIADVPLILKSDPDDVRAARGRLRDDLDAAMQARRDARVESMSPPNDRERHEAANG
jgi:hydrogenase-1 operon protein HyaF